jgi:hypothetical protein
MAWRRKRVEVRPEVAAAFERFRLGAARVEDARSALLLAVPSGRAPRLPLAEALAGFESGLNEAREGLDGWRTTGVEDEWEACRVALAEAAVRAERLRLEGAPNGYEQLAPVLEDMLQPLAAFELAARRFAALRG